MDRRAFLRTLGASALAAVCLPGPACRQRRPAGERIERVGLQLYTVRGELAEDFEGTLERVAHIGYSEVEFAGYFGRNPGAVRGALERTGLRAPAALTSVQLLEQDWPRALDAARSIGHRYLVVAGIPAEERRTLDDYHRLAELFNRAGEQAGAAGIRFAYHNHDFEFVLLEGSTPYDVLLAETDAEHVLLELDLYWITKGGHDPLAYFESYPGRFHLVHVKDSAGPPDHAMVDVGSGVIDFKSIFGWREQAGIRHFFVEHDQPPDAFTSIQASYEYLRRLEF
ncbi:MAG: sugar phosphate isomerase/epimerase [Gemmatimonadota bacterium]|nr:MAG: sugar phosphate isomerase/epimerase [Gemmatimonadota bacterium]